MADVKWIKIVTDIFDDEKILLIETLPDADSVIVIWFKLLCLAGKSNNSGVFVFNGIPYTDSMLATIFRRKESTVKLALQTFERFGMIKIINNTITIPNWGKHQSLDQLEAKRDYMRGYMAKYREKQKAITSGEKSCKANGKANGKANVSEAELDIDKDIDIDKEKEKEKEDDSLVLALKDFADFRKTIKKPLTERAKKLLDAELNKLAGDNDGKKVKILNQSILRGWTGVFALSEDKQHTTKQSEGKLSGLMAAMEQIKEEEANGG